MILDDNVYSPRGAYPGKMDRFDGLEESKENVPVSNRSGDVFALPPPRTPAGIKKNRPRKGPSTPNKTNTGSTVVAHHIVDLSPLITLSGQPPHVPVLIFRVVFFFFLVFLQLLVLCFHHQLRLLMDSFYSF